MNTERLKRELETAGETLQGIYEGVPYGGKGPAWVAICAAHVEDTLLWSGTDLNKHAAAVKAVLTPESWSAYCLIQTTVIKEIDAKVLTNGPVLELVKQMENGADFESCRAAVKKKIEEARAALSLEDINGIR